MVTAAHASGQGRARSRIGQQQQVTEANRRSQARAHELSQARDEASFDRQLYMGDISHQRSLDRIAHNADVQTQLADEAQDRRHEDYTYELTESQRAKINQLEESYENAVTSGNYTPEELADIRNQIDAEQSGIQPVRRAKEPTLELGGRKVGEIFSQGGFLYTPEPDGKGGVAFKKLGEDRDYITNKDRLEANKLARDMLTREEVVQGSAENGFKESTRKIMPTQREVMALANELLGNTPQSPQQDPQSEESNELGYWGDDPYRWAIAEPELAAKLIAKKSPSRKDFEAAGLPRMSAKERQEYADKVREVSGARQAPDGNWYVERDGKYYLVQQ